MSTSRIILEAHHLFIIFQTACGSEGCPSWKTDGTLQRESELVRRQQSL